MPVERPWHDDNKDKAAAAKIGSRFLLQDHPDFPLRQKGQILAEWEAFIQDGFRYCSFRPTLAAFLTRFLTYQPEHRVGFLARYL